MKTTLPVFTALLFAPLIALSADGENIRLEVINGRHWLIDPAGKPFFPHGVNHIEKHGTGANAKAVAEVCRRLGFSAYGYGTPDDLRHDMPYLESRTDLVPISVYAPASRFGFLDIFDAGVQRSITQKIAETCAKNRGNRNLIGYMWTDLGAWPLDGAKRIPWSPVSQTNWVQFCRALPGTAAGKQAYLAFLKSEYHSDFAAFNWVYQTSATSWEALTKANQPKETAGEKQAADDAKFLRLIARQYFKVVGEATRKNDPNHLFFGDRFMFATIVPEVMEEMLPYVDAIAIQPLYTPVFPRAQFDQVHALTKKPIIICDFAIRFKDGDKDIKGGELAADDATAGKQYAAYIREAMATPYIIGSFWCNLIDGPQPGGKPGVKQGLFTDDQLTPRPGLQSQLLELNTQIKALGKQGQR